MIIIMISTIEEENVKKIKTAAIMLMFAVCMAKSAPSDSLATFKKAVGTLPGVVSSQPQTITDSKNE